MHEASPRTMSSSDIQFSGTQKTRLPPVNNVANQIKNKNNTHTYLQNCRRSTRSAQRSTHALNNIRSLYHTRIYYMNILKKNRDDNGKSLKYIYVYMSRKGTTNNLFQRAHSLLSLVDVLSLHVRFLWTGSRWIRSHLRRYTLGNVRKSLIMSWDPGITVSQDRCTARTSAKPQ